MLRGNQEESVWCMNVSENFFFSLWSSDCTGQMLSITLKRDDLETFREWEERFQHP